MWFKPGIAKNCHALHDSVRHLDETWSDVTGGVVVGLQCDILRSVDVRVVLCKSRQTTNAHQQKQDVHPGSGREEGRSRGGIEEKCISHQ